MSTEHDVLPLYERQAARKAIEELVGRFGSQAAAGSEIGVSQNAVNKALLYTQVGPSVMRRLLDYLHVDAPTLVARYGDPSKLPQAQGAARPSALSVKQEAIIAGVRYGGVSERDVRALADKWEPVLKDEPIIVWVETLLREIQRSLLAPARAQKDAQRRKRTGQRIVRRAKEAAAAAEREPATAEPGAAPRRAAR